jgi:acetyl-CoA synthetase
MPEDESMTGAEDHGLPVTEVYSSHIATTNPPYHVSSESDYDRLYKRSISDPLGFWSEMANSHLSWTRPFRSVNPTHNPLITGDIEWFTGGKLNACFNCVDRWAEADPDRIAIIAEGDSPSDVSTVTFGELKARVCQIANMLKFMAKVKKGDVVTLYMPTVPELVMSILACARIGAVHSVVFAGFSAPNLKERIIDANSRVVICSDKSFRGGKQIELRQIVEEAVSDCKCVEQVFVFTNEHCHDPSTTRSFSGIDFVPGGRFIDASKSMKNFRPYCPIEDMDSEDILFLLYTSGSTGKPKAVTHTTAGYLLYAALTTKYIFDLHPGDVWACVADLGWITGHTYGVYGPLVNGNSTFLFESIPTYPDAGRYWDCVARHKITHFYTAPTALRTLMKFGDSFVTKHDRSSLRVLGSVGEPINPEAWRWYYNVVGESKCPIIDSYWQTETGGIVIAPLACRPLKPGSATRPFFGIDPVIVDPLSGRILESNNVHGYLAFRRPWPGMLRTILGDHWRMIEVYLKTFPGLYLTGDGCVRDQDGYYWITGRVDDVIKVSGHRMGSAEIEHALVQHPAVSESAVVGFPHPVKGEGLFCYVCLKDGVDTPETSLIAELRGLVRKIIGPVATPDIIVITPGLPKTRSGKIMRRILRKLAHQQPDQLGDTSTLADPSIVDELVKKVNAAFK